MAVGGSEPTLLRRVRLTIPALTTLFQTCISIPRLMGGVMTNPFTEHPRRVGEKYGEHARFAATVGFQMIAGGTACLLHAVFPFLFTATGSRTIATLHGRLSSRSSPAGETSRQRVAPVQTPTEGSA